MSTGTQIEVVMPQMGVSVTEGTITKWLKQAGEQIGRDEPLLEISTDKVDTEVPSPGEGVVSEILVQEGETVEVGTVIARIGPAGAPAAEPRRARACCSDRAGSRGARARRCACGCRPADDRAGPGCTPCSSDVRACRRPGCRGCIGRQREDVRLARRRAHRRGARCRCLRRPRHRRRRPCDEEGHPRVHRVGRRGAAARASGRGRAPRLGPRARAGRPRRRHPSRRLPQLQHRPQPRLRPRHRQPRPRRLLLHPRPHQPRPTKRSHPARRSSR